MWTVLTTSEYQAWFRGLPDKEKVRLTRAQERLAVDGPQLGRPYADTLKGSRHPNLKELRTPGTIRGFYAFDEQRRAVLLCGGDKTKGGRAWYRKMVRRADDIFEQHLLENRGTSSGSGSPADL